MVSTSDGTDPLAIFPGEIALQICLEASIPALLRLEAVSKSWKEFLAKHAAHIWSHKAAQLELVSAGDVASRPSANLSRPMVPAAQEGRLDPNQNELRKIIQGKWTSDLDTWKGANTWKEYCRRECTLHDNLNSPVGEMCNRILNTHKVLVWRLRPDYESRLMICTAHNGGLWVYDMDTGELLWNRSVTEVGIYAHLEHSKGTLAYNPGHDDTIEIWRRADLVHPGDPTVKRGEFVKVGRLPHEKRLRGWHLLYPTLCVVSDQGRAWTYDVSTSPPSLITTFTLARGARGHLDQDETSVMFCMTQRGYHVYDKFTGEKLGELDPGSWKLYDLQSGTEQPSNVFHVGHPEVSASMDLEMARDGDLIAHPDSDNVTVDLRAGPLTSLDEAHPRPSRIEDEEWGAGMLSGPYMVGVSRGGRVVILSDWKAVLKDRTKANEYASVIECQPGSQEQWDEGGWLTLGGAHGNQRAAWEVLDRVYLFPLPAPRSLPQVQVSNQDGSSQALQPIHAIPLSSPARFPSPISFMQLTEDHLLTTFSFTAKQRRTGRRRSNDDQFTAQQFRLVGSKCVRFINFAPWINTKLKKEWAERELQDANQPQAESEAEGETDDSDEDVWSDEVIEELDEEEEIIEQMTEEE